MSDKLDHIVTTARQIPGVRPLLAVSVTGAGSIELADVAHHWLGAVAVLVGIVYTIFLIQGKRLDNRKKLMDIQREERHGTTPPIPHQ